MVALAAAAAVTERVALSTMVLNNELRHPAVLANEALMVSESRRAGFTLGIGAGHAEDEHAAIGQPLPPPAERVDRLEEAVVALRPLLDGETVTTDGSAPPPHRAHGVAPAPTHPVPILVGGGARGRAARSRRATPTSSASPASPTSTGPRSSPTSAPTRSGERLALVRAMPRDRRRAACGSRRSCSSSG